MLRRPSRGNKFNAKRALGRSGRMYDSTAERDRADQLKMLEDLKEIEELREQTRVELEEGIHYRTDFDYLEKGRRVFEDVKGVETERFRLICKLWRLHGPGPLRILKRAGRAQKFQVTKIINPIQ